MKPVITPTPQVEDMIEYLDCARCNKLSECISHVCKKKRGLHSYGNDSALSHVKKEECIKVSGDYFTMKSGRIITKHSIILIERPLMNMKISDDNPDNILTLNL
jgi:hypothetical protein